MYRRLIDTHVTDSIKFGELTTTKAQLYAGLFEFSPYSIRHLQVQYADEPYALSQLV